MNDGLIYLASPYSDPDPAVMQWRFEIICGIAGDLMRSGQLIFSPIAHTHPIAARCDLPRGWDFWQRYDHAMLIACSKLLVAKMPGWNKSVGVAGEVKIARQMGIPIEFLDLWLPDYSPEPAAKEAKV